MPTSVSLSVYIYVHVHLPFTPHLNPEDGGTTAFGNPSILPPDYTAQ